MAGRVQRVGNTRCEFHLNAAMHLDKMANSKHALMTHHTTPSDSGSGRLNWGWTMRFMMGLLAAVVLLAGMGASHAVVRIGEDRGGRIGTYVDKYQEVRTSGDMVIIDGLCASACTIVLGAIPHDKICVTSHAALGFHAAWDLDDEGHAITNPEATHMLYSMYPPQVKKWINQRGGLTARMIYLRGKELTSMYHPCFLDARAQAQH
jgi:hypothetical protein